MIVQRICGVCTTTHALSSVRAAESALNIDVPVNAQYIRNIILAAHTTHDHIVHFYQLSALDWVDITSALQADPTKASEMLKAFRLASEQPGRVHQSSEQDQRSGCQRSVGYFRQWLLGSPGNETAAGSEPDCGSALPAGAGVPA